MDALISGPFTSSGGEYLFAALPQHYTGSTDNGKTIFEIASSFKIDAVVVTAFSYDAHTISGSQVLDMAYTCTQVIKPGQKKYVSECLGVNRDLVLIYYKVTENTVVGTHEGNLSNSISVGGVVIYHKR